MLIAAAGALGLLIGLVIGGLGGGGGVLTVPALVYLLGQDAHDATTGSVLIVGLSAVVGMAARWRNPGLDWRTGLAFGAVGIPTAYAGTLLNHRVSPSVLMLVFAAVILVAASAMLLNGHDQADAEPERPVAGQSTGAVAVATRTDARRAARLRTAVKILVCGAASGFLTGLLGVGGGFLVVPALVIVLRMPITLAIGTSLLIIVLNAGILGGRPARRPAPGLGGRRPLHRRRDRRHPAREAGRRLGLQRHVEQGVRRDADAGRGLRRRREPRRVAGRRLSSPDPVAPDRWWRVRCGGGDHNWCPRDSGLRILTLVSGYAEVPNGAF